MERILAAMSLDATDRAPVIAQVFGHAAVVAGVPLGRYVQDGATLARCQLEALERYGYDAVFALMDATVETEAMGSVLDYRTNSYPTVKSYALESERGTDDLILPDPKRDGRMPEILKAAQILREKVKDSTLVVGCVLGPLTLVVQLLGAESALYLAIDDPEKFASLLDLAADAVIGFGEAQMVAGTHLPMVFDPSASEDFVPHQFFREMEAPRLKRVFEAFRKAGACGNWLHIAGPVEHILPLYGEIGVNIANFDYCVAPVRAREALPQLCLEGNIKSLDFVDSSPGAIAAQSGQLMDFFEDRGGFILSSGCEIPPESRPENVVAMVSSTVGRRPVRCRG
ncbi:MAG: uroporphyrinogen decarboxylase family protein [Syntrophobacteraceae bacterium]|nr:uroporphyrinogen decarboxylase family protein [Syntrophobacteraceae bacterium]